MEVAFDNTVLITLLDYLKDYDFVTLLCDKNILVITEEVLNEFLEKETVPEHVIDMLQNRKIVYYERMKRRGVTII